MRALTWQAPTRVSIEEVRDPRIEEPSDAVIRVTSTAICGSDLHLYDVLAPYLSPGDVLGHEVMGIVEEVGSAVTRFAPGDRVVVPFVISCGVCSACRVGLTTQCESTQVREHESGAALYGYTELYGSVPGGQAERMRVLRADANLLRVEPGLPDDRYLFLSDILPTAWQGVAYAGVPAGDSIAILGLGPVGQLAARIARYRGLEVFAVDPVPERRELAERFGIRTHDLDDAEPWLRDVTGGRGPAAVVDAVGMEAHGNPVAAAAQAAAARMPRPVGRGMLQSVGVDRLAALHLAIDVVRRGGTVSLSGVYGGVADPLPMLRMFDKQITLRMGQCNVQSWLATLLPLVEDPADPLGVTRLTTHRVPLDRAPEMYETFKKKEDGCVKVVLEP